MIALIWRALIRDIKIARAQRKLERLIIARRNSYEVIDFTKRREAAPKGKRRGMA